MNGDKALLEFRWSNPKYLSEICGTAEGLKLLADAAARAATEGRAEVSDDGGTVVKILRDDEMKPPPKKEGRAVSTLLGTMVILYSLVGLLALVGAYTTWKWLFSS